jgi:hypothetical protein
MRRLLAVILFCAGIFCLPAVAQFKGGGGFGTPGFTSPAASGGSGTTTFDPANTAAQIVLSNGNLTATINNQGASYFNTRSIASHATGKFYWELTIVAIEASGQTDLGFGNASAGVLGFDSNDSAGGFDNGTALAINSAFGATITSAGWTVTNVVSIAIDLGGQLVWYRVNSGNWNNSGAANPATGTGGVSFSAITGPYYAAISIKSDAAGNTQITANFGATSYATSAPAGFGNM